MSFECGMWKVLNETPVIREEEKSDLFQYLYWWRIGSYKIIHNSLILDAIIVFVCIILIFQFIQLGLFGIPQLYFTVADIYQIRP